MPQLNSLKEKEQYRVSGFQELVDANVREENVKRNHFPAMCHLLPQRSVTKTHAEALGRKRGERHTLILLEGGRGAFRERVQSLSHRETALQVPQSREYFLVSLLFDLLVAFGFPNCFHF